MVRSGSSSRLGDILPALRGTPPKRRKVRRRAEGLRSSSPLLAACLLAGLAVLLLVGGAAGLLLSVLTSFAGPRVVARLQPDPAQLAAEEVAQGLPLALDLLAACLAGGAPLLAAARVVAPAVGGACGVRLEQVAAALALGVPPAEAWARLGEGDGPAGAAARALSRSADGGAPVALTVTRTARAAREAASAAATRRARRAGVLAVAPLGLCFLPAFIVLGVVPAVAGACRARLLAGL